MAWVGTALGSLLVVVACSGGGGTSAAAHAATVSNAATSLAPSPEPFKGGPRLYSREESLDFGTLKLGTMVKATFNVRNTGSVPLEIGTAFTRVVKGCCPTMPSVSKKTLKPDESGTINLEFTMHEGMGGPHLFEVVVRSNDAILKEQVVRVLADFE
jgi:hypothetical protein